MKIGKIKHTAIRLLYNLYKDEIAVIKIQDNLEEVKTNKKVKIRMLVPIIFNHIDT